MAAKMNMSSHKCKLLQNKITHGKRIKFGIFVFKGHGRKIRTPQNGEFIFKPDKCDKHLVFIAICNRKENQIFGFPCCSTREDLVKNMHVCTMQNMAVKQHLVKFLQGKIPINDQRHFLIINCVVH